MLKEHCPYDKDSALRREWQRKALLQIVKLPLPSGQDQHAEMPPLGENFALAHFRRGSPYGNLYVRVYEGFRAKAYRGNDESLKAMADGMETSFGAAILITILSYAPQAYLTYASQKGITVASDGFKAAIKNGWRVAEEFSKTDRRRAATLETDAGLLAEDPVYEERPFMFIDGKKGRPPILTVSPVTQLWSWGEIARRESIGDLEPYEGHRVCPANGLVMRVLWQDAVNFGLEPGGILASELGLA